MTEIIGLRRNLWLLAVFVALSLGGGTTIGIAYQPRRLVRDPGQACFQSAELGIRPGVERALCDDRLSRLANLDVRPIETSGEAVVGAARAELLMVPRVLRDA